MSGVVLLWHRGGRPVDRAALARLAAAQAHRGPDGSRTVVDGPLGLVHQHFRTTPEEEEAEQPLAVAGLWVGLDGFFSNRGDLLAALGRELRRASDARLLAEAYRRWGEGAAKRLDGAFAFAIWDRDRQRVLLARDALGVRRLVYTLVGERLLVASEVRALLEDPAVAGRLDETTAARFFAVAPAMEGRTFFREIREVPPGSLVEVSRDRLEVRRWWYPNPEPRSSRRADREYAEALREALDEAVAGCLRSPGRTSVLMSGGLDSTAVAAVAAALDADPLAVTWCFDTLPEADERREAAAMARHNGLEHLLVPSDDCAPTPESARRAVTPNSPVVNPFRDLLDRAYGAAAARAGRVVLLGWYADDHYTAVHDWLAEMLSDRGPGAALRELGRVWRYTPPWQAEGRAPLRHLASRLLPGGLRRQGSPLPPWLGQRAISLLRQDDEWRLRRATAAAARLEAARGRYLTEIVSQEHARAHHLRVEPRYPFATRRVFETLLSMPAYLLTRGAFPKFVQALALRKELPDVLVGARPKKHLGTLYSSGMRDISAYFAGGSRAVQEGWLDGSWVQRLGRSDSIPRRDRQGIVLWRALVWERWVETQMERRGSTWRKDEAQ